MSTENPLEVPVTEVPIQSETPIQAESPALEDTVEQTAEPEPLNLADKTLPQLSDIFSDFMSSEDRLTNPKTAEAIKAAFYRALNKIKEASSESEDFLTMIEESFKSRFNDYKRERAEYNARQAKEREANLEKKLAIIEELKSLVEKQEDVSSSFTAFRDLQNRWRETGPVPVERFRDVNETYQHSVEMFYDMVKINRDLRDLDFKKNLVAKQELCEQAEALAGNENPVDAFHELQKLHDQWKELGPVAKEFRDEIWNRFKAATAIVNKNYQAHFEGLKGQYAANLEQKTALCEKAEEIASRELTSTSEWNAATEEITAIQTQWRTVGFASKKNNQKIYDRFRAACDAFFLKKRDFFHKAKETESENVSKKMAIIEKAEALKNSTEWKKATDQFISLQKQWKEIGSVPRKKSEQLWTRFRAACDEFFAERDKQTKPQDDYYSNLKAKQALIDEIKAYETKGAEEDAAALADFSARWNAIGFVPFKEKDRIASEYKEAVNAKFPDVSRGRSSKFQRTPAASRAPRSEKDILIARYNSLQQDIDTYENNIGFFTASKNAEPLIAQMRARIESAKEELRKIEEQIRKVEDSQQ